MTSLRQTRKATLSTRRLTGPFLALALAALGDLNGAQSAELADMFRSTAAGSKVTVDHSPWDRLLKVYVKLASMV
jgi:hypothetical protein